MSNSQWNSDQAIGELAQRQWDEETRTLRKRVAAVMEYCQDRLTYKELIDCDVPGALRTVLALLDGKEG